MTHTADIAGRLTALRAALRRYRGQIKVLEEENARLRAELREAVPYTPDDVELFQRCFDRGLLTLDELTAGTRDERVERARQALTNGGDG